MKATTVSTSFFAQMTQKRLFAAQIAELAAGMAAQAGEAATRPLSKQQLQRAFDANFVETEIVMDLVLAWAGDLLERGEVSADDVYVEE